mmetsp:Transcript_3672/g.14444  ORF Transcript_3672/g.14444 Transcript_3672/m.14444 type:complete len:252 (-) Transcript_3672:425-1180(-)
MTALKLCLRMLRKVRLMMVLNERASISIRSSALAMLLVQRRKHSPKWRRLIPRRCSSILMSTLRISRRFSESSQAENSGMVLVRRARVASPTSASKRSRPCLPKPDKASGDSGTGFSMTSSGRRSLCRGRFCGVGRAPTASAPSLSGASGGQHLAVSKSQKLPSVPRWPSTSQAACSCLSWHWCSARFRRSATCAIFSASSSLAFCTVTPPSSLPYTSVSWPTGATALARMRMPMKSTTQVRGTRMPRSCA